MSVKTLEGALTSWSEKDPLAASEWAMDALAESSEDFDSIEGQLFFNGIGRGLVNHAPETVLELAFGITERSRRARFLRNTAEAIASEDAWVPLCAIGDASGER